MQRRLRRALTAGDEVHLQHLAECERESDERAEGADVEQRNHPGVRLGQHGAHGAHLDPVVLEVVHVQRRTDSGDRQQHQIYRAHPVGLPVARGRDHQQADQLDDRHPEVAAAGVERQCRALEPLRIERVDVCHGRGEVAAAETGQCRADQVRPQRQPGIGQQHKGSDGGDQQHQRREYGPVAPAEFRGGERVGESEAATHQGRDGAQQELIARGEAVHRCGHEQHHHRPDRPDREADVLGGHRPRSDCDGQSSYCRPPTRPYPPGPSPRGDANGA